MKERRKEIEDTHLWAARSVPEKRGEKLFTVKNSVMRCAMLIWSWKQKAAKKIKTNGEGNYQQGLEFVSVSQVQSIVCHRNSVARSAFHQSRYERQTVLARQPRLLSLFSPAVYDLHASVDCHAASEQEMEQTNCTETIVERLQRI